MRGRRPCSSRAGRTPAMNPASKPPRAPAPASTAPVMSGIARSFRRWDMRDVIGGVLQRIALPRPSGPSPRPVLGIAGRRGGCARMSSVAGQPVMGVGVVDSCRAHLVEVLAAPRDGIGQVDDVEDLGAAEAGDLHGSHAGQARGSFGTATEDPLYGL